MHNTFISLYFRAIPNFLLWFKLIFDPFLIILISILGHFSYFFILRYFLFLMCLLT